MQWTYTTILTARGRNIHLMPLFSVQGFSEEYADQKKPTSLTPLTLSTSLYSQEAVLQRQGGEDCHRETPIKDPKYTSAMTLGLYSSSFPGCSVPLTMRKLGCPATLIGAQSPSTRGGPGSKAKVSFYVISLTDNIPTKYYSLLPTVTGMQKGKRN